MQGSIGLDYYVARDKVTVPRRGKAGMRAKTVSQNSNGWKSSPADRGALIAVPRFPNQIHQVKSTIGRSTSPYKNHLESKTPALAD
ncbi:hypothetical protein hrd7_05140 [Leptolinea sp. HRD-7]|nr:hypothetical protein hrd7_05140 [Leptolinea sp. HRD-7]